MVSGLRITGFNAEIAIGLAAAVATLSCWLWLYKDLLDSRWVRRGNVRTRMTPSWNPVTWWLGAVAGVAVALSFFLTQILPWAQLHWSQDWVPLLFLVFCILTMIGAVLIALVLGSILSLAFYPIQVMVLAFIHASGWQDRLLVLLADIFIVVGAALALFTLSQVQLL